jgi:hypothetical protein
MEERLSIKMNHLEDQINGLASLVKYVLAGGVGMAISSFIYGKYRSSKKKQV